MADIEKLALAALVHDLPDLFSELGTPPTDNARRVLDLAQLDNPVLKNVLDLAEA